MRARHFTIEAQGLAACHDQGAGSITETAPFLLPIIAGELLYRRPLHRHHSFSYHRHCHSVFGYDFP